MPNLTSSTSEVLKRSFYERNTVEVAPDLLGKLLVRKLRSKLLIGRIVEVEAYRGADDPASHAFRGRTKRNSVMFGPAGHAYVYFTYGNHFCLNITTEPEGFPAALLIRAAEPVEGVDSMLRNRGKKLPLHEIANGPGKLTKAFAIDRSLNGSDMTKLDLLYVCEDLNEQPVTVARSPRVGIKVATDRPWRFFIEVSPYTSRR